MGHGHLLGEERLDRVGVAADLPLGRLGRPQRHEVHQRAGVDRPVELGVGADGDHRTGELARDAGLDEPLVGRVGVLVDRPQLLARRLGQLVVHGLEAVGARLADLRADVLRLGDVEVVGRLRVPHAELVERPHAVPEPLARHEQRAAHVEAERVVLERRAVPLAHEEADQALPPRRSSRRGAARTRRARR